MGFAPFSFPQLYLARRFFPSEATTSHFIPKRRRKRRLSISFEHDIPSSLSRRKVPRTAESVSRSNIESHKLSTQDDFILQRRAIRRQGRKLPMLESSYFPLLFALMLLCGILELGMTAWLISSGNETHQWSSKRYHSLLILLCFNASWTTFFSTTYMLAYVDGASDFLANIASSVAWLAITTILWGAGAGVMHNTRVGGNCPNRPTLSECRQSLTVEAVGWAEFGLCAMTMFLTVMWMVFDPTVRKARKEDRQRLV